VTMKCNPIFRDSKRPRLASLQVSKHAGFPLTSQQLEILQINCRRLSQTGKSRLNSAQAGTRWMFIENNIKKNGWFS
jgi:hypothetical protein